MATITKRLDLDKDGISGFWATTRRRTRGPAILLIHHNHGVTDNLKSEAFDYAELGYSMFVPNLYHLLGYPGKHHLGQGQDIQKETSDPQFVAVINKAWDFLVAQPEVDSSRVGVIGYCMGGRLGVHFAAQKPAVKAFAAYYPSIKDEPETPIRPRHPITVARELKCPSLIIYGGKDHLSPNDVQLRVWQSLLANGQPLEWHFYSEGLHGFVAPQSDGYQPQLAKIVRPIATEFLNRQLEN